MYSYCCHIDCNSEQFRMHITDAWQGNLLVQRKKCINVTALLCNTGCISFCCSKLSLFRLSNYTSCFMTHWLLRRFGAGDVHLLIIINSRENGDQHIILPTAMPYTTRYKKTHLSHLILSLAAGSLPGGVAKQQKSNRVNLRLSMYHHQTKLISNQNQAEES